MTVVDVASTDEQQLGRRFAELLVDARAVVGSELPPSGIEDRGLDAAAEIAAAVGLMAVEELRLLSRGQERVEQVCALALRAADLEADLRRHTVRRRKRALASVESGLTRLRCIDTSAKLIDRICREIAECTGLTRVTLSRIIDGRWRPWMVYPDDAGGLRPEGRDWVTQAQVPLAEMPLERSLLEHHHAELVIDARTDPRTNKTFVDAVRTRSYVAAPIIPAGRVVGFLHADHHPTARPVDRIDRDILWVFAEDFGRIYERTVLLERLHTQRVQVRETLRNAEAIMDNVARAELELARQADERSIVSSATTIALAGEGSSINELLTAREREVLELVVAGHNNSTIAEQLVIAEGTVKSHVKHILRKLGAVNRSELIARYLETIGNG